MNLTKALRAKIVEQFKAGHSMTEIGVWYGKGTLVIEDVIREWMIVESDANQLRLELEKMGKAERED